MGISEILLAVSLASAVGEGVSGAIGAKQQANAQAQSSKYNAAIDAQNATIALQNANWTEQAGEAQAGIQGEQNRATMGAIKVGQAASGVDVNTGSAADVQESAREIGALDALTIRSNATKQAYGYDVQAQQFKEEQQLGVAQAGYAEQAGNINMASSLIGGVSNASTNYLRYLQVNQGLGTPPTATNDLSGAYTNNDLSFSG